MKLTALPLKCFKTLLKSTVLNTVLFYFVTGCSNAMGHRLRRTLVRSARRSSKGKITVFKLTGNSLSIVL